MPQRTKSGLGRAAAAAAEPGADNPDSGKVCDIKATAPAAAVTLDPLCAASLAMICDELLSLKDQRKKKKNNTERRI